MIRGRPLYLAVQGKWVVMLLVIFIFQFPIFNSALTPKVSAQENVISVTATVEPSKLWQKAITDYSLVSLETSPVQLNQPVKITIVSKGLLEQILQDQKIKITMYFNDKVFSENVLSADRGGSTGFAFVPTQYGSYIIRSENITYGSPIPLSTLQFSIQQSSASTFVNTILKIFPQFHLSL